MEIWKGIVEFDNLYEVSNFGRVRSLSRVVKTTGGFRTIKGIILVDVNNGNGYRYVTISINKVRKNAYVHRLVATAFLDNEDNLPEVNHKDMDKTNNHVSNLEWSSRVDNFSHFVRNSRLKKGNEFIGVYRQDSKRDAYCFQVRINGKRYTKGAFKTMEDARGARMKFIESFS